jgi:WD40 repeat protein
MIHAARPMSVLFLSFVLSVMLAPIQSRAAEIASFKATDYAGSCVAISPDGSTVAIGGTAPSRTPGGLNEGIIKLYDISTGREKATLWQSGKEGAADTSNHVGSLVFSPDGKFLVGGDQLGYRLWDVSTGKELMFLRDGFGYRGAAFSPDGKTLALANGILKERGVRLVEVATGREVGMLPLKRPGGIRSVDFTPDGKALVAAGHDCSVTVWDVSTRMAVFKDDVGWILNCSRFSPDGHALVAAGEGGVVKRYSVTEKDEKLTVQKQQDSARLPDASYSVLFAPDGKSLYVCGSRTVVVWDTQTWEKRKTIAGSRVALSRDGKMLAVVDTRNWVVTIWDAVKYFEQK